MNRELWQQMLNNLCSLWFGEAATLRRQAEALLSAPEGHTAELEALFSQYTEQNAPAIAQRELRLQTGEGEGALYRQVLLAASGADLGWMEDYGLPVQEEERQLARFLFAYPQEKLQSLGEHIAGAFLHGFISQQRERGSRTGVRLQYCLGQEAIARQVVLALEAQGLQAVIQAPACLCYSTGGFALAHAFDKAACLSKGAQEALIEAYKVAYHCRKSSLVNICGMIGLGQFGEAPASLSPQNETYRPSEARLQSLQELENTRRELEVEYLPPATLSFCKVAFPNCLLGKNFPAVFEDFYRLSTMNSEKYEQIQQCIIDALDSCQAVVLEGAAGNRTRLHVALHPLRHPEKETNFLNCGGDLNVPHGELFTTPLLRGTSGLLHVREVYLKGVFFKNLRLYFEDGWATRCSCENYAEVEANRRHLQEHLLQHHACLPMGEFAIGSNTLAYAIAQKYGLMSRMPILLSEKMGPHIALGDPCFARGEEAPVHNLLDGKEMTARENEHTARRGEEDVYTNIHTDITLAFEEILRLDGLRADGSRVPVIRGGRFVLAGTEELNIPLQGQS